MVMAYASLVVAAELHVAAVALIESVEVVGLHDHIVEFEEAETSLHSLLIALGSEHSVYREARAYLAEKLHVVEVEKPLGVVDHKSLAVREVDKTAHLLFEALDVVLNLFLCEHLAHIGTSRGVADHAGAAAEKRDRLVACHLQTLHKAERHKVTYVKAVGCGVKADIKYRLAGIYQFSDFFFVCYLSNQTSCNEFLIYSHQSNPFLH